MPRKSLLSDEQISKIEEMLKAGAKVMDIVTATGVKDYQINVIKRRLGLVQKRSRSPKPEKPLMKTSERRVFRKTATGMLTVNDIRANLEAAQKEVARWQEQLIARVIEIEKMIATIKNS